MSRYHPEVPTREWRRMLLRASLVPVSSLCVSLGMAPATLHAEQLADIADLSLEQLSNIRVSSISKRQESLADAPASIYVITREDIRRSGVTSLPEALRLAPNLQVARQDGNQYAITARGFNSTTANKLLVQIDGRSVYTPLYSGVFWDVQDVMLEDIDRIEVVSGSGAAAWGSNAVNGVINIVTRRAELSKGGVAAAYAGSDDQGVRARYGDAFDGGAYRLYVKRDDRAATEREDGSNASDSMRKTQGGFRIDTGSGMDGWTLQGDAYEGRRDQPSPNLPGQVSGANLLGRWFRPTEDGGRQRVQFYYDQTTRDYPGIFRERLDIFDFDALQSMQLNADHFLTFSAGYRVAQDRIQNGTTLAFLPAERDLYWGNVFVNDDIQVSKATRVSVGARLETNRYTHWEWMPSLRISHKLDDRHSIWGALSRSVRTPSRIDRDFYAPATPPYLIAGGPDFVSEVSNSAELGFRAQPTTAVSYSLTGYYQRFKHLRGISLSGSSYVLDNSIEGHSYGLEGWANWRVTQAWRIDAGFSRLRQNYTSFGATGVSSLGNDPKYQYMLRNTLDLGDRIDLSLSLRHVSALPSPDVPAYTAVDTHVAWNATPKLDLTFTITNLFDDQHREFAAASSGSEFGRMVRIGAILEF